jgi:hypothetical protein
VSNINYLSINENFPVPGQDNDTQVFRDNFDTIKQSLRIAGEEITDLQDNVARTDLDSDFNGKTVQNAVLLNTVAKKLDGGNYENPTLTIDYENGSYQIFRFFQDTTIQFQNLPNDDVFSGQAVGKMTLEFYGGNSGTVVNAGSFVIGTSYEIVTVGTTDWVAVGASSATVGTVFTATGSGSATGTAMIVRKINFSTVGGTVFKKSSNFPTQMIVSSVEASAGAGNPVILEVWSHKTDRTFLNYLGQFSS